MAFEVQTEIVIECDAKIVWSTLIDFDKYSEWNPTLVKVKKLNEKQLSVEMATGEKFKPTLLKFNPVEELRWVGELWGQGWFFKGEHYFILEKDGKKTRFIHGETFSGLLTLLLESFLKKKITTAFIKMNEALKLRSEAA